MHPIIDKIINANKNTFVIFFVSDCGYSQSALQLLRQNKLAYKGYDISKIDGGMSELLSVLHNNSQKIAYDINHITKPIIFFNGKFIGGYDKLFNFINHK